MAVAVDIEVEVAEVEEDITEGEDKDVIIHTDVMIMEVDDTLDILGDMMIVMVSIIID